MPRPLPLFPLPLVLFPGARQPLHVFEPRYRRLLADCLAADRRFGVVCAAADPAHPERDPVPTPGTVGCVAAVQEAQPLPDGRSNVLVEGEQRFVLRGWAPGAEPYRTALVDEFDDEPGDAAALDPLADEVRHRFTRLVETLAAPGLAAAPQLPDDPQELSFAVAAALELALDVKQALLSERDTAARLQHLGAVLRPILAAAERHGAARERARHNGRGTSPPHPEQTA